MSIRTLPSRRRQTAIRAGLLLLAAAAPAATPPNLLVIYADDLGWGELGCQGGKDIPTPNIDAIARAGIRFTSGYVAATYCSPSRAGLLTGRYPTPGGYRVVNQAFVNFYEKHEGRSYR
jgi:arylsulfatase A-like enzyme